MTTEATEIATDEVRRQRLQQIEDLENAAIARMDATDTKNRQAMRVLQARRPVTDIKAYNDWLVENGALRTAIDTSYDDEDRALTQGRIDLARSWFPDPSPLVQWMIDQIPKEYRLSYALTLFPCTMDELREFSNGRGWCKIGFANVVDRAMGAGVVESTTYLRFLVDGGSVPHAVKCIDAATVLS